VASIAKRDNGQWRARYRDATGKEHAQHFGRKVDAQRWLDETTTAIITGQYVSPGAGKINFRDYAEAWRAAQMHRPSSQAHVETMLRRHAYPVLGARPLADIRPSDVQAWAKGLSTTLAPSTVGVVHGIVSGIFRAAVRDRKVASNPCEGTRLPKAHREQVVPMSVDQVHAIVEATPARWRAIVVLAAGTGMRQGECLGLTLDRVDFLRRTARVDRQLVSVVGREPYLGPPKTAASVRTIPLPQVVLDALAVHVAEQGTAPDGLLFTSELGTPMRRTAYGSRVWRPAMVSAGTPGVGFHSLRHFYASLLIRHGESVKTVQARLGHASAAETLDTYSHLWPDSDDRTRVAVDAVLDAPLPNQRGVGAT